MFVHLVLSTMMVLARSLTCLIEGQGLKILKLSTQIQKSSKNPRTSTYMPNLVVPDPDKNKEYAIFIKSNQITFIMIISSLTKLLSRTIKRLLHQILHIFPNQGVKL